MNKFKLRNKDNPIICTCNFVDKEAIESAIKRGCKKVNHIYDATTAGLGPCGGSCRPTIFKMLDHYLTTGEFLKDPLRK